MIIASGVRGNDTAQLSKTQCGGDKTRICEVGGGEIALGPQEGRRRKEHNNQQQPSNEITFSQLTRRKEGNADMYRNLFMPSEAS